MSTFPQRRKVLVLKDEACVRRVFILANRWANEGSPDGNAKSLLSCISQRRFDQVVVDLRYPPQQRKDEVHGIGEIRPILMGKMLVIVIQVSGPKTLELVERYLVKRLPPSLLWLICHN